MPDESAILGRWRLLRADPLLDFAPGVGMHFEADGRLLYSFEAGDHREMLTLWYRVEGDQLHTQSPVTDHETTARFSLGEGGALILDFAGARAWFLPEL